MKKRVVVADVISNNAIDFADCMVVTIRLAIDE